MNLILTSFWNTWKWIALAGVLALLAVSALLGGGAVWGLARRGMF